MKLTTRWPTAFACILALGALVATAPASAQEQGDEAHTVELSPVGDSGVHGTATIHEMAADGGEMEEGQREGMEEEEMHDHRVVLQLQGLEAGGTYPAHVHRGTCSEPGSVFLPLESVTAGEDGEGTSTTTVTAAQMAEKMEEMEMEGEMQGEMQGEMEGEMQGEMEGEMARHPSFLIMAHLPDGNPAACGDIPMEREEGDGEGEY